MMSSMTYMSLMLNKMRQIISKMDCDRSNSYMMMSKYEKFKMYSKV